jgi:hypothetical protein
VGEVKRGKQDISAGARLKISWASSTQWLVQFCTLTVQRRTHIHVLVVHNQKKPNIYVTLQGAKFKAGITLVQQQLTSSLYFQAPYYIFFFFYFYKKRS